MKFSELKVGQKFKYPRLDEIMTKVEIPKGIYADGKNFGILDAQNRVRC